MKIKIVLLSIVTLLLTSVGSFCQKLVLINSVDRRCYPNAESIILCTKENSNLPQLKEVYNSWGTAGYPNPLKNSIIGTDEVALISVIRYLLRHGEIYETPDTDNMLTLPNRPKTLFEIYSIFDDGSIWRIASIRSGKTKEERSLFNQEFLKVLEELEELKAFATEYRKNVVELEAHEK